MAIIAGDVLWRIGATMEPLSKAMVEAEAKVRSSTGAITQTLSTIGRGMTVVGGAITAGIGLGIKAAIDFETAWAGVEKTVDAPREELDRLREQIRALALEIPVPVEELSRIAEIGGQMGVPVEAMLDFTRTVADLGVSTDLAAEQAATMIAQFANVAGTPQAAFRNLASAVIDLGNSSEATEQQILEMGQRLVGAGSIVGMTEGDILGMAAALSSVGIEAEMGGSSMSRVMVEIESAVAKGSGAVKAWADVAGMSAQQFAEVWRTEPTAAITAFVQGLANIEKSGGSAITTLESMGITEIRLRDTLLRTTQAAGDLTAYIRQGNEAFTANTALTIEAEKRYATTASQLQLLKNQVSNLAITIGGPLLSILNDAAKALAPVLKSVADWMQANPKLAATITIVMAALGALMVVVGPLLMALPGLIALGTALASAFTPVGGIILAVVAAVAALAAGAAALYYKWDEVQAFFIVSWDWMREAADTAVRAIGYGLGKFFGGLAWTVTHPIEAIKYAWAGMLDFFAWVWDGIVYVFSTAWNWIVGAVLNPMQQAWEWLTGTFLSGFAQGVGAGMAGPGAMRLPDTSGIAARGAGVASAASGGGGGAAAPASAGVGVTVNLYGTTIREEADVHRVADQLANLLRQQRLGLGM